MGFSYIGDDSIIWFGYFYQFLDVSGMAGSHFHHAKLVFGFQAEKGERHTDWIVQVSQCVQYVVLLRQDGGYKFLGRSLAVGSGDADNTCAQLAVMIVGKLLQGMQAVVH